MNKMDILFQNVTAVTMNPDGSILENTCIGITGGKIVWLSQQPPAIKPARTLTGSHWVVMPGFINTHTHLPMTLLRGYAEDMALHDWLFGKIIPVENNMRPSDIVTGTLLGLAEAAAAGVTSVTDMYNDTTFMAQVAADSGLKANLGRGLVCLDDTPYDDLKGVAEMREAFRQWHGHDDGRIVIDASAHTEFTFQSRLWRLLADEAREKKMRMHIHISETRREHDECVAKRGVTPTAALAEHGVFDVPATVAHGVWLTDEDMDILAQYGATVAHCPVSNMKLASGAARLSALREHGVNTSLGSDSMASHNAMDMCAEMKTACLLQKVSTLNPQALTVGDALAMATRNGAKSQGREKECGQIAVGFDADLAVFDFDKPHLTPCFDVMAHLVYAARASDVIMTLVRGRLVYDRGAYLTIDLEKVLFDLRREVLPHLF
ncbi:MAG: amidohydrolase [Clostridiales bacterium]|jgi:5-methylthioadenosine/S-adenosylhomocysteine deaminase|nr:amidohydrolase [Clostridiales bacterium]